MRVTMMLLLAVILAAAPLGCGDKKTTEFAKKASSGPRDLDRNRRDETPKREAKDTAITNRTDDSEPSVTTMDAKAPVGDFKKSIGPVIESPTGKEPKKFEEQSESKTDKSPAKESPPDIATPVAPLTPPPAVALPAPLPTPPAVAEAVAGTAKTPGGKITKKQDGPQSGILTAGSFDDNLDPAIFNSFVAKRAQRQSLGDLPGKMIGQRLMILVRDSSGKPIGDARVKLTAANGATAELTTRSDGKAIFMLPFDQLPVDQPLTATVAPPYNGQALTEKIMAGAQRWEFTVPNVQAQLPKNLDLAIVLDTTGSMQDEINHLKAEIRGICQAVQKKFPEVNQRFSLICYRDEGDEYVVRSFDFNASLDKFHDNIAAQSAAGGGDYPEAMHKGLEAANQLRWRERDTASVLFLIADAPPHAQHMNRTLAAANSLRKRGVAIYPVACSGYDDDCEFVMRSCALLTGSQFLFLTDDSGVGGAHAEPKIPYYSVERLEKLMVRMIASELSGQRVYPNPQDIIRSVGGKRVN